MRKIAITIGVFDCLHEGHVNLLKKMREEAGIIFVFLHDDYSTFLNKGRFPVQAFEHRKRNLIESGFVADVFEVRDADPSTIINKVVFSSMKNGGMKPEEMIYLRGDDWCDFPGRKAIEQLGIEIKFVHYTDGVSTSQIRNDLKNR